MREALQEIVSLQTKHSAASTPEMRRRGTLVRNVLPDRLRRIGARLRTAMGSYGDDADAHGRDNTGQRSHIPWVRWHSKSRSPHATDGWYVVYLFHPGGAGVSLCLSHGSTQMKGKTFKGRSEADVDELMRWAGGVVGGEFSDDRAVGRGIVLGDVGLGKAYERTTVFSKFYPTDEIPSDLELEADLVRFLIPLAKLYRAREEGIEPGAPSPESVALRDEIDRFISPLSGGRKGQGRGLSPAARKLIEYEAMHRAKQWLKEQRFEYQDVSATESCDFRAQRSGQEWMVEVKGTTGGLGSVLLTRNEVNLHRTTSRSVLLVVHGLSISEDGTKATGGELVPFLPWELEEERLNPMCYEYRLG